MDWGIVLGWIGAFFSFMSFLFYIFKMKIQPLDKKIDDNRKELEHLMEIAQENINKEVEENEKKLDNYIADEKEFRKLVFATLEKMKLDSAYGDKDNLKTYITKEDFLLELKNAKEDREQEYGRLESLLKK
jgi:hypothetical protein